MEISYVLTKYVQSRLLQNCRMRERVKQLAEASESVYMKEGVKVYNILYTKGKTDARNLYSGSGSSYLFDRQLTKI